MRESDFLCYKEEASRHGEPRAMNTPRADYNAAFKGTLLEASCPSGFSHDGRRLLAECPEFKLLEMYEKGGEQVLESSEAVERAYHKAQLKINDAPCSDERIAWAIALSRLAGVAQAAPPEKMALEELFSYDYKFRWPGNAATASKLAMTLGREILGVLESKDPAQKAEECVGKFKNALDALIRKQSCSAVRTTEYLLFIHAQGSFRLNLKRPTKSDLSERLGYIGISYKGKNAKAKWWEKFSNAGLGELPA